MRFVATPILLFLAACGSFPQDTERTLDNIEHSRRIRLGLTELEPSDRAKARAYIARLERITGARAEYFAGPAETQLAALENGDLDLVIGEFAEDSPWLTDVALIEPIAQRTVGERKVGLAPVAANGENRWIGLLEKAVRDQGGGS